ncbi:SDR family NAD(P)-dependent oxidoreductase [Nocardia sp. NPDC005366]|uniref:SDR family NAD(P)-dependent oxidoreductase n=1 Tax=Nocardia sp. NPDC005366 TaxID=3156878 RepID=UPI0033A839F5
MDLTGVSAIVTGGAGGLGEGTVRRLVEAGVKVVIADLSDEHGKALEAELGAENARFVSTNVLDSDSLQNAIDVAASLGAFRIAAAAHGATEGGLSRILDRECNPYDLDSFRRTIDIYLTGTFNVTRLAAAAIAKTEPIASDQRGVIVNTASIAAFEGQPGQSAYSAAKGGVVGLGLVAARDLSKLGIRVMTIAPGTFFTPAFRMEREDAEARFGTAVPNPRRMGSPDEYGLLVRQIAENDYLNGECIRLDGALRFAMK